MNPTEREDGEKAEDGKSPSGSPSPKEEKKDGAGAVDEDGDDGEDKEKDDSPIGFAPMQLSKREMDRMLLT